ncbi:uncharacterized protein LOC132740241 [Ruditapes philippinarum]|uniref:uncharacterized protein LOC132740241 n=1 Tax=Ruditapes philippinarum TaxID=129788 RepID=UPI00295BBA92|nr:uncharacterized protein LOC132740241 [Ruditapes philippinarum]
MDCFDPFKDYFELEIPRGGCIGNEESSMHEMKPEILERSINNIMFNDSSEQWTSYSGSDELLCARPVLGRRDSVNSSPPFLTDINTQRKNVDVNDQNAQATGNVSTTGKVWDYKSSTVASKSSDGIWGSDNGVWIDMNDEIRGHIAHQPNDIDTRGLQSTSTVWNGNMHTSSSYSSTGFFGSSDASVDTVFNEMLGNSCLDQAHDEERNTSPVYPRYSNGLNVEYPESISHVAFLLNKLMQQGNSGVSYAENGGYRNSRSLDEGKFCAFCKRNRERREFYTTHVVKDSWGKVICPILRKYTCPICGATGDGAHTLRHCPARPRGDLN